MANRLYRSIRLVCCDTCSDEWFGAGGEAQAREHAKLTHHQVRIEVLVRETLNEVAAHMVPMVSAQVKLTAAGLEKSRAAALMRLAQDGVEP